MVERDDFLRKLISKNFPDAEILEDVELITDKYVDDLLQNVGDVCLCIVTGGWPCKDHSFLKSGRQNFQGEHGCLFFHLPRIRRILMQKMECKVRILFENVQMDAEALKTVNLQLGTEPILVDSARIGAASRPRLWWCDLDFAPGPGEQISFKNGIKTVLLEERTLKDRLSDLEVGHSVHSNFPGNFPCITGYSPRECQPPKPAGIQRSSLEAREHWRADLWATNVFHYEPEVLVYRKRNGVLEGCLPSVNELERFQGLPAHFTKPGPDWDEHPETTLIRRRNALGNCFHKGVVKRLLLNILVLSNVLEPSGAISKGIWDDPFLLTPKHPAILDTYRVRAASIALEFDDLTADFTTFAAECGHVGGAIFPTEGMASKADQYASVGVQRSTHLGKEGPKMAVELNLKPEEHISRAKQLPHPFDAIANLGLDIEFSLQGLRRPPQELPGDRQRAKRRLEQLSERCAELDNEIRSHMVNTVARVVGNARLGLILTLTYILKWPDWELPDKLFLGMPIIDFVPASNLFKPAKSKTLESTSTLLAGNNETLSNDAWNIELVKSGKPRPGDSKLLEITEKEIASGKADGFYNKRELDLVLGKGAWRASKRWLLWQETHQKYRAIDNCKTSSTNEMADQWESLVTPSHDLAVKIALRLCFLERKPLDQIAQLVLGCEDMENAYRSVPSHPEHYPYCVISIFHPVMQRTTFVIVYALLFGQTAAVNGFNRVPAFMSAITCRIFRAVCWHFFDDFAVVESQAACTSAISGQNCLRFVAKIIGLPMGADKAKEPKPDQIYLGILNALSSMPKGFISLVPTEDRISKVSNKMCSFLSDGEMSPDDLNSLRGDLVFLSCTSFGKVIRGGLRLLSADNLSENNDLKPSLKLGMWYFLKVLRELEPRKYMAVTVQAPPVLLYTDACWEEKSRPQHIDAGMGALLFLPNGECLGAYCQARPDFLGHLKPRKTQITPLELATPILAVHTWSHLLRNTKVLLFIDNQAAAAALATGTSTQQDIQCMVSLFYLSLEALGLDIWVEWIESDSNPSDLISRTGAFEGRPAEKLLWPQWLLDQLSYDRAILALKDSV